MTHLPHARVLASAGTGKTHRLTSRYLDLVLRGADPRTLLATTFTRAAAAEIRERVLVRVAKGLLEDGARDQLANDLALDLLQPEALERVLGSLLRHLSELQICTIDSFVARLTTVGSQELGLGSTPELIYDDRERGLQARILRRIFDRLDSEQALAAFADSIDGLSKGSPKQSITDTLQEIVGFGLPPFHETQGRVAPWLWSLEDGLDAFDLTPIIDGLRAAVVGHSKAITTAVEKLCESLESLDPEADRFAALADTRKSDTSLCMKVRAGEPTYGRGKNNLIDQPLREAVQRLNDYVDRLVLAEYGRRTLSTHALLARYHEAREVVRREQGVASFQDLVRVLVEADPELLRDELWFRLDGRIDHLLLDEFQDTSLMQWKVLRPLAEEIVSDGTGERTFFSVGDIKQSIYGWRGGLPEILEHLPTLILEGGVRAAIEDEDLYRSWRTGPEILGVVNAVFSTIDQRSMMQGDEHLALAARRFRRIWVDHEPAPGMPSGCFELITSPLEPSQSSAAEHQQAAAFRAAEVAAELHRAHPGLSIGVLTPQNKVAARVVALLRRQGLDATGEGGGSFLDCGASLVFLDALRLASHPGDSAAAFNLRTSPLKTLLDLGEGGRSDSELARALRGSFASKGIARTFEDWFAGLAGHLDQRELTRIERLISETERLEAGGVTDLVLVRRELEGLRLDEPGSDTIRVMTIHGSKGLAFDLVVLTGIDGPLIRSGKLVHERDPDSLELRHLARWVKKNLLPPEIEPLQTSTQAEMAFERLCQLYVAMTRARKGLFVVVAPPGTSRVSKTSMGTLLCQSFPSEQQPEDPQRPELLASAGSRQCLARDGVFAEPAPRTPRSRIRVEGAPIDLRPTASPSGRVGEAVRSESTSQGDAEEARRFGSAIHGLFELIEFIEDPLPDEERLRTQLRRVWPQGDRPWQDQVLSEFQQMLERPEVRSVLSRKELLESVAPTAEALRVWREAGWLELTEEGVLEAGVFDRVVVFDRGGTAVGALLVDWKTDRVDSTSAEAHAHRYRAQLEAYRSAVATIEGLSLDSIDACIIFPRAGIRVGLGG